MTIEEKIKEVENSISLVEYYKSLIHVIDQILELRNKRFNISFIVDNSLINSFLFPLASERQYPPVDRETKVETFSRIQLALNILFRTSNFEKLLLLPHKLEFKRLYELVRDKLFVIKYKHENYKKIKSITEENRHEEIKRLYDLDKFVINNNDDLEFFLPLLERNFKELVLLCNIGAFEPQVQLDDFINGDYLNFDSDPLTDYIDISDGLIMEGAVKYYKILNSKRAEATQQNTSDSIAISQLLHLNNISTKKKFKKHIFFFSSYSKATIATINLFPIEIFPNNKIEIGVMPDVITIYESLRNHKVEKFMENLYETKFLLDKFFASYNELKNFYNKANSIKGLIKQKNNLIIEIWDLYKILRPKINDLYNLKLSEKAGQIISKLLKKNDDTMDEKSILRENLIYLFKRENELQSPVILNRIEELEEEISTDLSKLDDSILISKNIKLMKTIVDEKFRVIRPIPYYIECNDPNCQKLMNDINDLYRNKSIHSVSERLVFLIDSAYEELSPDYNLLLAYVKGNFQKWDQALIEIEKGIAKKRANKSEFNFLKAVIYRVGKENYQEAFKYCMKANKTPKYYKELGLILYFAYKNGVSIPDVQKEGYEINLDNALSLQKKALENVQKSKNHEMYLDILNNLAYLNIPENLQAASNYINKYKNEVSADPFDGTWSAAFLHTYAVFLEKSDYKKNREMCIKLCKTARKSPGLLKSQFDQIDMSLEFYENNL